MSGARRGPGGGPGPQSSIELDGIDEPHGTSRLASASPTVAYLQGRERVLGRRLSLHREPCIAAALLLEELGPLGARAWVRRLLAELEVR